MGLITGYDTVLWEDLRENDPGRNPRVRIGRSGPRVSYPRGDMAAREAAIQRLLNFDPTQVRDAHLAPIDPFASAPRTARNGSASGTKGTGRKKGPNKAEKAVRDALERVGWDVHRGGLIDFIAQRAGRLAFIEVKNRETRDRLSTEQRNVLADLRHRGVEEYVLDVYPSKGEMVVWTVPNVPPVPFIRVFGG